MDPSRWREVRELFEAALDLDAAARRDFLGQIHDTSLRADVERLLQRHSQSTALIDKPAAQLVNTRLETSRDWDQDQIGRRVGPFQLVALLGAGGMGTVYRAERRDGSFDQVVAIKLVLSAHPGLRERFRREQEILAALRHPGIAQLIDGGEADDGIPYLVMEYIEGSSLTDYCRERMPELKDRLRLVREITQTLAHAHRNLIVHRDIKPTNILIEHHSGRPMLLDFGIAKLIGDDSVEMTAQRIGPMTPAYAAPEQFLGQPVSVATDVYQIGVLLYQLITGRLPFAASDALALSREVLEGRFPTLQTAHRAAHNSHDVATPPLGVQTLPPAVARDLDALLRKAMARDPAERYGSMDALAADIEAVLEQRPLQARAGTRLYPLVQFVRRHRWALSFGGAAILGLLGATGSAIYQTRQAVAEAERARVAVDFMREVFKGADPNIGRSPNAGALELIDLAASELDLRLGQHTELRGPLAALMATAYSSFGAMDRALPLAHRAIADLEAVTTDGLTMAAALESGAWIASRNGQRAQSLAWASRSEAIVGANLDAESIRIRDGLLLLKWTMAREDGELEKALTLAEESIANASEAPLAIRDVTLGRALQRRGTILTDMKQFSRAERDIIRALELTERSYGRDDYRSLRMQMVLGWHYTAAGNPKRGLAMLQAVGPKLIAVYGERSQTVGNYYFNVANADTALGRLEVARDGYLRAARTYELTGAAKTSYVGSAMWNAASMEMRLGNLDRAEELCDEIERRWEGVVPPDAPVRELFAKTRAELSALIEVRDASSSRPSEP